MVEAETRVVWDQFNTEGPKGPLQDIGPQYQRCPGHHRKSARSRFVTVDYYLCATSFVMTAMLPEGHPKTLT